jgi:hypothetical protein
MAVKWKGGEQVVEAAVAKLKSGLGAREATINGDFNDAVTISPPDDASYYTAGKESFVSPAIFVIEAESLIDPNTEAQHSLEIDVRFAIYVADQDADRQHLGKKLQRHARAVTEVIWDDDPKEKLNGVAPFAGQTAAWRVTPIGTTPGAAFQPDQPDAYGAYYIVIFNARTLEE